MKMKFCHLKKIFDKKHLLSHCFLGNLFNKYIFFATAKRKDDIRLPYAKVVIEYDYLPNLYQTK
jgi:hypothetical protein